MHTPSNYGQANLGLSRSQAILTHIMYSMTHEEDDRCIIFGKLTAPSLVFRRVGVSLYQFCYYMSYEGTEADKNYHSASRCSAIAYAHAVE